MEMDVYLARIRPYAKGCPDRVIRNYLIITLRDICHRANVWRQHDKLFSVEGVNDYTLTAAARSEIATVQNILREVALRKEIAVTGSEATLEVVRPITVHLGPFTSWDSIRDKPNSAVKSPAKL